MTDVLNSQLYLFDSLYPTRSNYLWDRFSLTFTLVRIRRWRQHLVQWRSRAQKKRKKHLWGVCMCVYVCVSWDKRYFSNKSHISCLLLPPFQFSPWDQPRLRVSVQTPSTLRLVAAHKTLTLLPVDHCNIWVSMQWPTPLFVAVQSMLNSLHFANILPEDRKRRWNDGENSFPRTSLFEGKIVSLYVYVGSLFQISLFFS